MTGMKAIAEVAWASCPWFGRLLSTFHPTNPADGAGTLLFVRLLFPETVGLILALEYSLNFPLS